MLKSNTTEKELKELLVDQMEKMLKTHSKLDKVIYQQRIAAIEVTLFTLKHKHV